MAVLTIDNIQVDLSDSKIVLNKSAYSFSDWLTKDLPYSERVRLSETNELNELFKRPKNGSILSNKFNKYYSYSYSEQGKIVSSGIAILLRFNSNNQYEIQLIDSSKSLVDGMKNNINALDFEDSDFVFNSTNYDSLKVLNDSVWLWAAASMYEEKTLSNSILNGNLSYSRPFFSVQRILEKIFNTNNWIYSLSENSNSVNDLIISSNSDSFYFTSYEKKYSESLNVVNFDLLDLDSYDFIKTDTVTGSNTLLLNYNSQIRFRGFITASNDCILQIGGVSSSATNTLTETFIINKGTFFYDFTSKNFKTDDTTYNLQFSIIGTSNLVFDNVLLYTTIEEQEFGSLSALNYVDFKVKVYDNLPDISQINLFKHCMVNVSGFFNSDNFKKELKINSINEVSKLSSLDWSSKLIESSIEVYLLSGYGKINYYSYDNDKVKPSNLGRGSFEVDNQTLKDTEVVYKSIFAASQEVEIDSKNIIDLPVYGEVDGINERLADLNPIIGYYENVSNYTIAKFDNLNGNNILENFYSNFVKSVQRGELFKANFDLNKSDYFLFDFNNTIYLEQYQSSYYVIDINNYIEGEVSEVILLKAI